MWAFIFLYVLGLNVYQATGQEMSTQMYYTTLIVDETAIENVTTWLTALVKDNEKQVDDLRMTTICEYVPTGTNCTCLPGYKWSETVCATNNNCCGKQTCFFPKDSTDMCVSNTSVNMRGTITLKDDYLSCLADTKSDAYNQCNNNLLQQMKAVFSTLRGFDTLSITKYSLGSIIADFVITIAYGVNPQDLINKTLILTGNLSATVYLRTTGLIILKMPENPVPYNSSSTVTCTAQDLDIQPIWQLKRAGITYDITNGTESEVIFQAKESKVNLKNITELWAGEYTCLYKQTSQSYSIDHVASDVMSVALLPNIDITTSPAFPLCENKTGVQIVIVKCEVASSSETYIVKWEKINITTSITPISPQNGSDGTLIYEAVTAVSCETPELIPQLRCTFTNRRNQTRSASINVNIIGDGKYCAAEGVWGNTKAGFTAVIKCTDAAGRRQRQCTTKPQWENEISGCVDKGLNSVLEKANIVNIGLGLLEGNSARVFSDLQKITQKTEVINTFSNLKTSVDILNSMKQRVNQINNISTVNALYEQMPADTEKWKLVNLSSFSYNVTVCSKDDFLDSSSNLLEKSLKTTWQINETDNGTSVAEIYLSSCEHLIQISNVDNAPKKANIDVNSSNCINTSKCYTTAFNVTVYLESSVPGRVRTAAFQELQNYLPNKDGNYTPNSIVTSTTIESNQSNSVNIKINFPLLQPRPRNVEIKCVSWDNETRSWSEYGCTWDGAFNEGGCRCNHLSSFAILMSKRPLEVPGLTELTYVGLSISVVSLIISLVIELITWSAVVRTNSLYLRHTAHVNISLCLLVADCCFLASSRPRDTSLLWCKTFVVLKHFCYLSMFFWMLCLSTTLLHQAVFLFHSVSKKNYLRYSLVLGYVCPFLIVFITFLANNSGDEGSYFSHDTCWLIYSGLMKGSIHTFIIPVGIIVFINVFSMLVVIMKLLDHPKNAEKSCEKEKKAALTVLRSVILLTPVFGLTWIFGFAVIFLDLTTGTVAFAVNYIFTLLNAFQGLFILLTTCLGDKLTRDALLHRLKMKTLSSINDNSTKTDSTVKK